MQAVPRLDELRGRGGMDWVEDEQGWVAAPEDVMGALSKDGFDECKRETTTSRRDTRPAGGVWQGVNRDTGSVASAIWVNRPTAPHAVVFITIDGVPIKGACA
jgi:hypothetical protein